MGLFKNLNKNKLKSLGKSLAQKGLPLLANTLSGGAAGTVLNLIGGVLGTDSDEDSIEKALQNNPDALVKLRELENQHREELEKIALEMARIEMQYDKEFLEDKDSARNREIELAKVTGHRDLHMYILAWTVVVAFFGLTGLLIFKPLEGDAVGYINQLFGAMATGFGLVLSYFFGSSRGSANKQAMMHMQSMRQLDSDPFKNAKG